MAGLLYHVPGVQTPDQAVAALRKTGAAHAVDGVANKHAAPGPGGPGVFVCPVGPDGKYALGAYDEATQKWVAVHGKRTALTAEDAEHAEDVDGGRDVDGVVTASSPLSASSAPSAVKDLPVYWIGFERERPPGPEDLARERQLPGHDVRLAGADWLVPVARLYTGRTAFPRKLTRADGQWLLGDVAEGCAALWDIAVRYFDEMNLAAEEKPYTLTEGDAADMAATCLAANYRLGPEEIGLLALLDTQRTRDVLNALIDLPSVMALKKKAPAPGGTSTGPGATA